MRFIYRDGGSVFLLFQVFTTEQFIPKYSGWGFSVYENDEKMKYLRLFFIMFVGNLIGHYICKWLDRYVISR